MLKWSVLAVWDKENDKEISSDMERCVLSYNS